MSRWRDTYDDVGEQAWLHEHYNREIRVAEIRVSEDGRTRFAACECGATLTIDRDAGAIGEHPRGRSKGPSRP